MNAFSEALQLYDRAESHDDSELWRQALAAAEYAVSVEPAHVDAWYLAGLCAYNAHDVPATHKHLRKALALDSGHTFARLYLGHQLYDEGRYSEAAGQFEHVDASEFDRIGQHWRALKLAELRLCCRLYLGESVSSSEVERLAAEYRRSTEDEAALPAELVDCVISLDIGADERLQSIARTVTALAEAMEMKRSASMLNRKVST